MSRFRVVIDNQVVEGKIETVMVEDETPSQAEEQVKHIYNKLGWLRPQMTFTATLLISSSAYYLPVN